MRTVPLIRPALALAALLVVASPAQAQVLIWSIPSEQGAWVRFEGTYRQTQSRPNSSAGDLALEWRSELTIGSVGAESAEYEGESVKCRWVEFKSVTKPADLEKQPGPGDVYVYKVLIPEKAVIGRTVDDDGIPVTFIPIIRGYRKVGSRDVETVSENALAVYPTIALITWYPDLKATSDEAESLSLQFSSEPVEARVYKGTRVLESATARSTNEATLWLSEQVPFGLARFQVSLTREEKASEAPADQFRRVSVVAVEMAAVATGTDARSELPESR